MSGSGVFNEYRGKRAISLQPGLKRIYELHRNNCVQLGAELCPVLQSSCGMPCSRYANSPDL